jgi:iron complex transport system substrate-binding protein
MRILSLLPAATDIVAALGATRELVSITHECDDPEGRDPRPRVTSTAIADGPAASVDAQVRARSAEGASLYSLDAAAISALRPDVILTQAVCDVCAVQEGEVRELAARLRPSPQVVTLAATTFDGVLTDIQRVAAALEIVERGAALVDDLGGRLRAVHDRLRAAAAPRPRATVIEWTDPLFIAGHWVPDMMRRAGGLEVLGEAGKHSTVTTADRVAAAEPAVIIGAPCGYDASRAAVAAGALLAQSDWQWARPRPLWAIDANTLTSRPGPLLVRGVEVLAAVLHPTLFAPPPAAAAVHCHPGAVLASTR